MRGREHKGSTADPPLQRFVFSEQLPDFLAAEDELFANNILNCYAPRLAGRAGLLLEQTGVGIFPP